MKKILFVSPSESFRARNTNLLNKSIFQVASVASGKEALQYHHNDPVDIVISELLLDDMGGDDLCSCLRELPCPDNFSFVLVCHELHAEVERAKKSKASSYITKPVQPVQLFRIVGDFASAKMLRSKRVPLEVKVKTRREKTEFQSSSHDVSITGILIETEEQLNLGDQITCQFPLPGISSIESKGEIARYEITQNGGFKYGVQFSGLKRDYRQKIDQYVTDFKST